MKYELTSHMAKGRTVVVDNSTMTAFEIEDAIRSAVLGDKKHLASPSVHGMAQRLSHKILAGETPGNVGILSITPLDPHPDELDILVRLLRQLDEHNLAAYTSTGDMFTRFVRNGHRHIVITVYPEHGSILPYAWLEITTSHVGTHVSTVRSDSLTKAEDLTDKAIHAALAAALKA